LATHWEVLAEAIQTVVRAEIVRGNSSVSDPYAVVKDLTRGTTIGASELATFVAGLDISEEAAQALTSLTPATYVGLAASLVDYLNRDL
jgi:adenylosuccinate lyase